MQNNSAVLNIRGVSHKRTVILLLGLIFTLPTMASNDAKHELPNKASHIAAAKKSKINKITDLRVLVDISGSMK